MDDIVKQAIAKWPDVPHCYGWLALDARGTWRMRNEQAQLSGLAGERITHAALLGFINRNYAHDERGYWYFQNGPQRVYVNLETTPYIARTDPAQGFVLHTGQPLHIIDAAWMTEAGQLILVNNEKVAMVDDRDMGQCIADMRIDDHAVSDEQLIDWLGQSGKGDKLSLHDPSRQIPIQFLAATNIASHFGFIQTPKQSPAQKTSQ